MKNNLFISHATQDKEVVDILANLIRRVSLNQICIWFSNDTKITGGFMPGDNWYDAILNNLEISKVVISFITENSNNKPWILYESGYAEALEETVLIPLKFTINIDEISQPLRQKQIYSFSNLDEIQLFLRKVLKVFEIQYDEEVFRDIVVKSLDDMRQKYSVINNKIEKETDSIAKLSRKVDSYFSEFLTYTMSNDNKIPFSYEIEIEYEKNNAKFVEYIKIQSNLSCSDILDEIYYLLYDRVKPYTYLSSWVLVEKNTKRYAIIWDIQDWVPANFIFKPGTLWKVVYNDNSNPYFLSRILGADNN